jgi:hypothetical protein
MSKRTWNWNTLKGNLLCVIWSICVSFVAIVLLYPNARVDNMPGWVNVLMPICVLVAFGGYAMALSFVMPREFDYRWLGRFGGLSMVFVGLVQTYRTIFIESTGRLIWLLPVGVGLVFVALTLWTREQSSPDGKAS